MDVTAAGTRVLVIDDDAVSRDVIRMLLQARGHSVAVVPSGESGLDVARRQQFQTVLVDLQMPGLSGRELAAALREICGEGSNLIAMSGSVPANGTTPCGYDAFLPKPFAIEAFVAVLSGASRRSRTPTTSRDLPVVLDRCVYDKLSAVMQPSQLEKLYALCLDDSRRRIDNMALASLAGDEATFRREAHAAKGGAGMVGASELQKLASSLEEKGFTANYLATLDEMKMACSRLEGMLFANERRE